MKARLNWIVIVLFASLIGTSTQARWSTYEDTDSEIEFENVKVHVNRDGSYSETIEQKLKVLKESARDQLTTRRLVYNAATTSLKVLEAKTINDDVELVVDPKLIEDKPLASSPHGFDQHNQVLIAFPGVNLHSEIYLKYVLEVREPPIPGFFSLSFVYGSNTYEKSGRVTITSEIPLNLEANDPDKSLRIKTTPVKSDKSKFNQIEVTLKRPVYREPTDEIHPRINPKAYTWVDISSAKEWAEMGQPMLSRYNEILNQPLPKLFSDILGKASKQTTVQARINAVTSRLAERINYLGDWRPVSGLYVPHDLKVIAQTKLADCKDFSAATASILRRMGYTANIAWIKRGIGTYDNPTSLPTVNEFNHAIVQVRTGEQTLWIDPTNFSSFAQGTFPDIADRRTLVLDASGATLKRTPPVQPSEGGYKLYKQISLNGSHKFKVTGSVNLYGAAALPFTGLALKNSKKSIDYFLVRTLGDENRISNWNFSYGDLTPRIVSNLSLDFKFMEEDLDVKTSAGPAISLSPGATIPLMFTKVDDRVSDLFLGNPETVRREIHLKSLYKKGSDSLQCTIDSPWLSASRDIKEQDDGIHVFDSITVKKAMIPNTELRGKEFSTLQKQLNACFHNVALVFDKAPAL